MIRRITGAREREPRTRPDHRSGHYRFADVAVVLVLRVEPFRKRRFGFCAAAKYAEGITGIEFITVFGHNYSTPRGVFRLAGHTRISRKTDWLGGLALTGEAVLLDRLAAPALPITVQQNTVRWGFVAIGNEKRAMLAHEEFAPVDRARWGNPEGSARKTSELLHHGPQMAAGDPLELSTCAITRHIQPPCARLQPC
ncbi:MAG: hypothetical protein IOC63_07875 [Methylobacterium sp.]|nr:hypothetical protein [Methylobacterium sp.]